MPNPNRWWTLAAVCVATFMLLLDITIVNIALPKIQQDGRNSKVLPAQRRAKRIRKRPAAQP